MPSEFLSDKTEALAADLTPGTTEIWVEIDGESKRAKLEELTAFQVAEGVVQEEPLTTATLRLANAGDFPGYNDTYVIRDFQLNPLGLSHVTQMSGPNVYILTSEDVEFNVNSIAVATQNSANIQAIIDALPDSGGAIGIPHDIALTTIVPPRRVINGTEQIINFRLFGTRPGVQIYGMSTDTFFLLEYAPSNHLLTRVAAVELLDLCIICRGPGVSVFGCGLNFYADNVIIRASDNGVEVNAGPAWRFQNCYGLRLGSVGAIGGYDATGFYFDSCNHVTVHNLVSRDNYIGLEVGMPRPASNDPIAPSHRSSNHFGSWDCEGNTSYQVVLNQCQKFSIALYMESDNRMTMANCENMDFAGDGFRVDEIDYSSTVLNPKLFQVDLVRAVTGQPYSVDTSNPLTFTGPSTWSHDSSLNAQPAWYVDLAPELTAQTTEGKVYEIRFRVKGTGTGYVNWYTDEPSETPGQWDTPPWSSITCELTADWVEYATERAVCPGNGSFITWQWNQLDPNPVIAFPNVEFQLLHIAEVVPRDHYTVSSVLHYDTAAVIDEYVGAEGEIAATSDSKEARLLDGVTPGGFSVGNVQPTFLYNPELVANTPYQLPNARHLIVIVQDVTTAVGAVTGDEMFLLPDMYIHDVIEIHIGLSSASTLTGKLLFWLGSNNPTTVDVSYNGYVIGPYSGGGTGIYGEAIDTTGVFATAEGGISLRIVKYADGPDGHGTSPVDGMLLISNMVNCEAGTTL